MVRSARFPSPFGKNKPSIMAVLIAITVVLLLHLHYVNIVISSLKCPSTNTALHPSKLPINPQAEEEVQAVGQPLVKRAVPNLQREDKAKAKPNPPSDSNKRLKILELSYMRSGSTFCGDILQAHQGVFYVYEPLLYLWDYYIPGPDMHKVDVRRRTKPHWLSTKRFIPNPLDFLDYMFNCNITAYNIEFLTNIAHSQDFTNKGCITRRAFMHAVVDPSAGCVNGVLHKCEESKAVVQKVVRLSMAEADVYLDRDPSIRVIHLLRDPRGIMLSRMHFNNKTTGEMHKNYTYICHRLWDDIRSQQMIAEKHWGKILTVRYEDLAQDPLFITSAMYRFAGLDLSTSVRQFVHDITSSDILKDTKGVLAMKTSRKNPLQTAYNWRQELPFSLVQKIDRDCRDVYNAMGYLPFKNEKELRNLKMPAKRETYGEGLMTPWNM